MAIPLLDLPQANAHKLTALELSAILASLDATGFLARSADATVARLLSQHLGLYADVADFVTPAMVTANDYTAAIIGALATGKPVRLLPGPMRVTGPLACNFNGQRIVGHGRTISIIMVDAAFAVGAAGVFVAACGEAGPEFCDLSVQFAQPDTSDPTALRAYPAAFSIINTPRCRFTNIRILAGYVGIDFVGNSGGVYVDGLETSCLYRNVRINGSIDSMRFLNWHTFPTGLSANHQKIFNSSFCSGLYSGRCDDLHLTDCLWLCGRDTAVVFYDAAPGTGDGTTFGTIIGCDFDTNAGLNIQAGNISVIGGEMTQGDGFSHCAVVSGGYLRIVGSQLYAAYLNPTLNMMQVTGGVLTLSANTVTCLPDMEFVHVTNGQVNITGNQFVDVIGIGNRVNPTISLLGGTGTITGNTWHTWTGGDRRIGVSMVGDLDFFVGGNNFNGYGIAATVEPLTGSFDGNINLLSDMSGRVLVGAERLLVVDTFQTDGAGNLVIGHGLNLPTQRIIMIQGQCKAAAPLPGFVPLVQGAVTASTMSFSGGVPNSPTRVLIGYNVQPSGW